MTSSIVLSLVVALLCCTNQHVSSALNVAKPSPSTCRLQNDIKLEHPLRIGAWNVQKLGQSKMGKKEVVDVILKVMLRYDIIVLQEIVDKTEQAPFDLLKKLNEAARSTEDDFGFDDVIGNLPEDVYEVAVSKRLGKTSRYKEQYAFYYRRDKVILNGTYQYPDAAKTFQIPPFVAIFDILFAEVEKIAFIPIHTAPGDAVKEIDALVDVYHDVTSTFGIEDIILLGDLNAGCNYVKENDWLNIRLRSDAKFRWLISDHMDTTTKGTSCPYDRIIVTGSSLSKALYEGSAAPFYFYKEFDIQDQDLIHDISDHYPVEVLLRRHVPIGKEIKVHVGVTVTVETTLSAIQAMKDDCLDVVSRSRNVTGGWTGRENVLDRSGNGTGGWTGNLGGRTGREDQLDRTGTDTGNRTGGRTANKDPVNKTSRRTKIMRLFNKFMNRKNKQKEEKQKEKQENERKQEEKHENERKQEEKQENERKQEEKHENERKQEEKYENERKQEEKQENERKQEEKQEQKQFEIDDIEIKDLRCGREPNIEKAGNGILMISFYSQTVKETLDLLDILGEKRKCVFTQGAVSILKYKLFHGVLTDDSIYGEVSSAEEMMGMRVVCLETVCYLSLMRETVVA